MFLLVDVRDDLYIPFYDFFEFEWIILLLLLLLALVAYLENNFCILFDDIPVILLPTLLDAENLVLPVVLLDYSCLSYVA